MIYILVLTELGRSTQAFAELAGRTEGLMTDVIMALIEMGLFTLIVQIMSIYWSFALFFDRGKYLSI